MNDKKRLQVISQWAIVVIATFSLLFYILFAVKAYAGGSPQTSAAPATAGSKKARMQKAMPESVKRQLTLQAEMEELSAQLAGAKQELAGAEKNRDEAVKEKERLANAKTEMMDNIEMSYQGEFYTTAYCCEKYPHICGGNGVTASGTVPTPGLTIAADWNVFPPGTWLYIEGVGLRRVEDSGSAIKGRRIDVAIDTHENALRWGGQGRHHVWIMALS